jgi:hypothetical protein
MLTDTVRLQPNCYYLFAAKLPKTITIVSFLGIYISLGFPSFSPSSFLFGCLSLSLSHLCCCCCSSSLPLPPPPRCCVAMFSAASLSNARPGCWQYQLVGNTTARPVLCSQCFHSLAGIGRAGAAPVVCLDDECKSFRCLVAALQAESWTAQSNKCTYC